jgi:hypothetical protein
MVADPPEADAGPMTAIIEPSGRRAGATWVAATGAFLLLAGAAVFVAVRWDRLPDTAKLGLVATLTAAFLAGGRGLRRSLPATGDVLFHLGAFLLPVDLAAVALRSGTGWRVLVLAEGILGVVAFAGLAAATGSVVLRWAATASVAVVAAGVAAVSSAPAPLVLAAAALAAELSGDRRLRGPAWVWAAVAGLAPVLGAVATLLVVTGLGTVADLGLAGAAATSAAASGVLAAAVLARQTRARDDLRLALLAVASLAVGLVTAAAGAALPASTDGLGLAAVFLTAEVAALLGRDDPFWGRPLAGLAAVAEIPALAAAAFSGLLLLAAPFADHVGAEPVWATALAVLAIGLVVADGRRYAGTPRPFGVVLLRGGGWAPATVPAALAAAVAVEVGTGASLAAAAALLVVTALAALSDRPWSALVVAGFAPWAVVTAAARPLAAATLGLAGAVLVAEAAVRRARRDGTSSVSTLLAAAAAFTALTGVAAARPAAGLVVTVAAAVPACWLLALQLDRAERRLGDLARLALAVPFLRAVAEAPHQALPVALSVTALLAADTVRLGRRDLGVAAALALQGVVAEVALIAGISGPGVGLALSVAAVAWAGLALVVDDDWRLPFVVATGAGLVLGLLVAAADPVLFADALLVAGGLAIGAGVAQRRARIAHLGGGLCTLAVGIRLVVAGVQASEPYVAPVALQLLIAGGLARRRGAATAATATDRPTSWQAYVPSVALLGGTALAERLAGAPAWHALLAGAVGLVAVAVGGWRRLAGPMLVGTGLLVAVTVHESLGALAGVPTWAWLSAGGALLLGVGVGLERHDTSPVEAGRRLVDVVAERFG